MPAAVGPLGRLSLIDPTGDLAEEAALALGRCQMEQGDAAMADLAFARVIDSRDAARRAEARFNHSRALRLAGRYEEALAVMRETPTRVPGTTSSWRSPEPAGPTRR